MARDATNMPFPRSNSFRKRDTTEHISDSHNRLDASLSVEHMLLEEFNYASLTAYQAMEDRARITSVYYLLLGVLVSVLVAIYQFSGGTHALPQFFVVLLLLVAAMVSVSF